ncbi:MAG: glycosyltransferase family 4 protein [Candidatus Nanoarchaeia archaeon]
MTKVLIATDGFLPRWDGIVRFLLELVPLLEKDFSVRIVAPKFEGEFNNPFNSPAYRFELMSTRVGDIRFSRVRKKEMMPHVKWADVVFTQSLGSIGMVSISCARKAKKPVVSFLHLIEWELATKSIRRFKRFARSLVYWITRYYYNRCDLLLCPSEEMLYLYERNGIKTPKKLVSLGLDVNHFKPAQKYEAKKNLGVDPESIIIGYHGRIGREKDLLTLYRAFRRVEKKSTNVKLMIVGKGVRDVEDIFTSTRNVILPGAQNDVVPFLQAIDIYVMPSLTETTSLSTLEAMSCGLPVISTPAGSIKSYIKERENGMLFPFKNSMRLAMKIEVLIQDKSLRERLGRRAREYVQGNFNWEDTYSQVKEVLEEFKGHKFFNIEQKPETDGKR